MYIWTSITPEKIRLLSKPLESRKSDRVAGLRPAIQIKTNSSQPFFEDFEKLQINYISKQHFVAHLLLYNAIGALLSKQWTVIHNSVKCCSFHEKIHVMLDLANKMIKMTRLNADKMTRLNKVHIFFHEMNTVLVFYHRKIARQSEAVYWPNQLEIKKVKASLYQSR